MIVRNDVADWLESSDEQTLCDDFLTEEHEFDNYLGKLALNLGYEFVTDFIVDLKRNGFVRENQTNTGMRIVKWNFCVSCSGISGRNGELIYLALMKNAFVGVATLQINA